MKGIPRRRFLQTSSGLLGGFFLGTSFARARPLGPNDSLNIGVIGSAISRLSLWLAMLF